MPKQPFAVLQLINNLDIGGAQEVVRTLAAYLPETGCRPVVCSFKDGPLRQEIERLGVPVEIIPGRRFSMLSFPHNIRELWRIRQALADLIVKYEIQVIQTHLLRSLDFLVLTLRNRSHIPLVFWTIHNSNFELQPQHLSTHHWLLKPKQLGYRLLYRLLTRWVSGFIAVSADVKTALRNNLGLAEAKITVICNGVDLQRYSHRIDRVRIREQLGLGNKAQVLVMVATFKEQKGHRHLIAALAPIISDWPQLQVLLAGDGPLKPEIEEQVRALGLTAQVHFLGSRSDVRDLLVASDYFVLPSLWEGLPMALIEAMASGLPIISSDVSGTRQVMVPNETGLMVPPGDVARLREAIVGFLGEPQKAMVMGAAARGRVEACFSAEKQAEEHARLYRQVGLEANTIR